MQTSHADGSQLCQFRLIMPREFFNSFICEGLDAGVGISEERMRGVFGLARFEETSEVSKVMSDAVRVVQEAVMPEVGEWKAVFLVLDVEKRKGDLGTIAKETRAAVKKHVPRGEVEQMLIVDKQQFLSEYGDFTWSYPKANDTEVFEPMFFPSLPNDVTPFQVRNGESVYTPKATRIFLGSFAQAENEEVLDFLNIKIVIDIANMNTKQSLEQQRRLEERGIMRKRFDGYNDDDSTDLRDVCEETAKILDKSVLQGGPSMETGNVLVHCSQGKSRSATLVIDWLLRNRFADSYDSALQWLKLQRRIVQPNAGFEEMLRQTYFSQ